MTSVRIAFLGLTVAAGLAPRALAQSVVVPLAPEPQLLARTAAQVKDDLFAGTEKFAQGASDVTEVNLDPNSLGMMPENKGRASDLARKMNFVVIHSYTYPRPGMYRQEDVDVYRRKLTTGNWSCAIHVKEKTESTDICSRSAPDHEGTEMVILAAEEKELTFIHLSGRMSLADLQKMGSNMGKQ